MPYYNIINKDYSYTFILTKPYNDMFKTDIDSQNVCFLLLNQTYMYVACQK